MISAKRYPIGSDPHSFNTKNRGLACLARGFLTIFIEKK